MSVKREWTKVSWGKKNKGKTLPQIIFSDPDWFFWAVEKGVFKNRGSIRAEAKEVYVKATHIKIPHQGSEEMVVEYGIHPDVHKSVGFEIVPATRDAHQGSTGTFRLSVIDLSIPRKVANYDKLGYKITISDLKSCIWKGKNVRLTKEKCEDFFSDNSNFIFNNRIIDEVTELFLRTER